MKGVLSFAIGLGLSPSFLAAQPPQRNVILEPIHVQKKLALIIRQLALFQESPEEPGERRCGHGQRKRIFRMRHMRVEVDRFSANLQQGDLTLFYYAGHGVQANEQNCLIPIDFSSEADLPTTRIRLRKSETNSNRAARGCGS
ncbi:MAG TPA: caspase family protein [Bryobacteraceae bacterium]|nr:caspase family protein [Bryobacteraceae bacterium]